VFKFYDIFFTFENFETTAAFYCLNRCFIANFLGIRHLWREFCVGEIWKL